MKIYVECKPDEVLLRKLGIRPQSIRHAGDKGRVCRNLQKDRGSMGIVDEDPGSPQPSCMERLRLLQDQHGIRVLEDPPCQSRLIVLCPRLEGWILDAARQAGIEVERRFGLPDDETRFHKIINLNIDKFEELIEALLQRQSPRLRALRAIVGFRRGRRR